LTAESLLWQVCWTAPDQWQWGLMGRKSSLLWVFCFNVHLLAATLKFPVWEILAFQT
jgi:hypothetical protein